MLKRLFKFIRYAVFKDERGEICSSTAEDGYTINGIKYSVKRVYQSRDEKSLTLSERVGRIILNEYSGLTKDITDSIMASNCMCLTAEKED